MGKDNKKFEVKYVGKEERNKINKKIINKIGEDEDVLGFVNGKIILLLIYELIIAMMFLSYLFQSLDNKAILLIICNLFFFLLYFSSTIKNIVLINKLQKTITKSKK